MIFRKALLETKGLGQWSAEYISLRGIGDPDAFPRTDLILKRVLALHPSLDLEAIKPWRSYAAIYLWKAFAQSLSKQKRLKQNDAMLPDGEVGGRKTRIYGQRRNSTNDCEGRLR
jgi:hypothetical protein